MILLEASPVLQNIYLIIAIIMALITICTTAYALIQKIKAKDWKGAAEEADKLLGEVSKTVDQIKDALVGTAARRTVSKVLKDQGAVMEASGLKNKMDDKLRDLGLNNKS